MIVFDENDWNHLHDAVLTATNKRSTDAELYQIYNSLPDELKYLANTYGMSDTVFREAVIEYYLKLT